MEHFHVSRPTLREAVRVLESEGLVEVRRGSRTGARVRVPGPEAVAKPAALLLELSGATLADVAKFTIYIVDYNWDALEALMTAAKQVFGEPYPLTANTVVGVAALWLPDLLIEVEATAVV